MTEQGAPEPVRGNVLQLHVLASDEVAAAGVLAYLALAGNALLLCLLHALMDLLCQLLLELLQC